MNAKTLQLNNRKHCKKLTDYWWEDKKKRKMFSSSLRRFKIYTACQSLHCLLLCMKTFGEKSYTNHLIGTCSVRKIIDFLLIWKIYIQIGIFFLLCNYNFKFLVASNVKTIWKCLNIFLLCAELEFCSSRHKDVFDMTCLHAGDINKMDVILISKLAGYFLKLFSQTNQPKIQVKLCRKFQNPVSETTDSS